MMYVSLSLSLSFARVHSCDSHLSVSPGRHDGNDTKSYRDRLDRFVHACKGAIGTLDAQIRNACGCVVLIGSRR